MPKNYICYLFVDILGTLELRSDRDVIVFDEFFGDFEDGRTPIFEYVRVRGFDPGASNSSFVVFSHIFSFFVTTFVKNS